jgi:hypothetical protein
MEGAARDEATPKVEVLTSPEQRSFADAALSDPYKAVSFTHRMGKSQHGKCGAVRRDACREWK